MIGLALARAIVTVVSGRVPEDLRARWLLEWQAELWHESQFLKASKSGRVSGDLILVRAAFGAVGDARTLRELHRSRRRGGALMARVTKAGAQLVREFRYAVRQLARNPGFSTVSVLTLSLGIGANTAIFSVVHAVLLRPLPYPSAERLVAVGHRAPGLGSSDRWGISRANYLYYRDNVTGFEELGAWRNAPTTLTGAGEAALVSGILATSDIMELLGARSVLGRVLIPSDNEPGGPRVVVLGYDLWSRKLGADSSIIGKTMLLGGTAWDVVGVMAPGIQMPNLSVDLWRPLRVDPSAPPVNSHVFPAIARLAPGYSVARVQADLDQRVAQFPALFPSAYSQAFMEQARFRADVTPLHRDVVGDASSVLWVLLGAVSLVLFIACANVANLFIVRSQARRREMALREALGASRSDLARYLYAESIVLALIGGAVGVGLAYGGIAGLLTFAPRSIPRFSEVTVDGTVLGFAVLVSLATGLAFGSLPLMGVRRVPTMLALREGGRGLAVGAGRVTRKLLLIGQVAMAMVLLVAAGLMIRTFVELRSVDPGFDPTNAMAFNVSLPAARYRTHQQVHQFYTRLSANLGALPGATFVGGARSLPLEGDIGCFALYTQDNPVEDGGQVPCVPINATAPGYFEAMAIPIIAGRPMEARDNDERTGAVVLSKVLAEQLFPDEDPVGKQVKIGGNEGRYMHVVGVAGAVRRNGLEEPPPEVAYFPFVGQEGEWYYEPVRSFAVVLRVSRVEALDLAPAIRAIVGELDSDVPVSNIRTLSQVFDRAMIQTSLAMVLMGIAAGVALLLGAIGIYGVFSYVVSQRTVEVGIRIALGAPVAQVVNMILKESMRVVAVGIFVGLAGALAFHWAFAAVVYGVGASDPSAFLGAGVVLATVAGFASYLPARRASRVDPMIALRAE